jgi:hypothetical protein
MDVSLIIDFKFIWVLLLCISSAFYDIIFFVGVRPPLRSSRETLFLVAIVELEIEFNKEGVSFDWGSFCWWGCCL